jgi:TolB protein
MSRTHLTLLIACIAAIFTAPPAAAAPRPVAATTSIFPVQDAYPHVSKDGRIVFQSKRAGGSKLFIAKLDGSDLHELISGPGDDHTPMWSPDGKFIAFASARDGNEDVWIVGADGTGLRNLTRDFPKDDSHPAWSPDGKRIIFCSTRGDGENDDIYVMNADGTNVVRLTDNGLYWDTFPSFSPDGGKILFRRLLRIRTEEGTGINSEIFVMNADGTGALNLSKDGFFDGWPAWSPDGRYIAFSSNREDYYQIFVMKADGSGVQQVVHSSSTDVRPKWLPDGRGLVFNRESEGRLEILRADF